MHRSFGGGSDDDEDEWWGGGGENPRARARIWHELISVLIYLIPINASAMLASSLSSPPSPSPLPISSLRVLVYTIGGVRGRALARIRARFRSPNTPDYPRVDTPGTANIPRDLLRMRIAHTCTN